MTPNNHTCEQLLDSSDAAHCLKINPKTPQCTACSGRVSAVRIGKLWRFERSARDEWLKSKIEKKK
jgi:excisionase family DNA binding protein